MASRTRIVLAGLVAAWLCLSAAAMAAMGREATNPQGVPYLSGGVGSDERADMETLARQYNLKLEFAVTQGNYLGEIAVHIRGPVTLDAISEGPWFLAQVPPGKYEISVDVAGMHKSEGVTVGASGQKTVVFRW